MYRHKESLPVIGWFCFLLFLLPADLHAQTESSDSVVARWIRSQGIHITPDNRVKLLKSGEEKFTDLFEAVRGAKHSVHLEYFNFRNDSIANALFNLLAVKVKQGVEVRALFDAFGNMSNNRPLKKRHVRAIRNKGIQLYKWDPLTFPWLNHIFPRDHRKIVVIDGKTAYTGGMNVADYYLVGLPKIGPWRDMHLRIEGGAVFDLQNIFIDTWNRETKQIVRSRDYYPQSVTQEQYRQYRENQSQLQNYLEDEGRHVLNARDSLLLHLTGTEEEWNRATAQADSLLRVEEEENDDYRAGQVHYAEDENGDTLRLHPLLPSEEHYASVAIIDRVPRKTPAIIRDFYATALDAAQYKVQIINPYFSPTRKVKRALKRAIDRGIDVQIMIPSKSDIPFTPDAAYRAVNKLRKRGATVYLYDGGFHHSKVMMVDDRFCTVGSANLDSRSLRYDYEVNAVIFDHATTGELVRMFENDTEDSRLLTDAVWKKRSVWRKFVGWFASLISWCL